VNDKFCDKLEMMDSTAQFLEETLIDPVLSLDQSNIFIMLNTTKKLRKKIDLLCIITTLINLGCITINDRCSRQKTIDHN
jgi:hypothetical protein